MLYKRKKNEIMNKMLLKTYLTNDTLAEAWLKMRYWEHYFARKL